ncbi:RsmE family RNA methyltransferase [Leptospira brenneri]|uniref:Ribosomal RNA small subunit methyltransferase E n=1 Tax=Leptospira brenneri TaxID=2023182 RepID=A0A5F1Z3W7_9LEPT|nr:RsmE family RNA methyltransferase [Leptospira brenneri]TGK91604.1 RsmE family RNA methyltransferase [Leptospira brenneri]
MNWILVYEKELNSNHLIQLTGERHLHIQTILKKNLNESIQVVIPGSGNYLFQVHSISENSTTLEKTESLPNVLKPLDVKIFFSLPRPQTGKKLLHLSGGYGVHSVYFFGTDSKNKEYWTSPVYGKDLNSYLETGMSQTGNSQFPNVHAEKNASWRSFLKSWKGKVVVLDREGETLSKDFLNLKETEEKFLFVFGPESGWKPDEILFFKESGFKILSLGKINLRTEFAYSAFLHQLFLIKN